MVWQQGRMAAYLMISLSLIMRLISWTINALTHTVARQQRLLLVVRLCLETHSLCESENHCGSWSCWRIEQPHFDRLPTHGSRTLPSCISNLSLSVLCLVTYLETHAQTAQSDRSCRDKAVSSCVQTRALPPAILTSNADKRVRSEPPLFPTNTGLSSFSSLLVSSRPE